MTLKTLLAPLGVMLLLAAWLLAKNPLLTAFYGSQTPVTAEAPDFSSPTGWYAYPEDPPPSVWEDGWDVDLFLLPVYPKAWTAPGLIPPGDADYSVEQDEALAAIMPALMTAGPVYSPNVRLPAPLEAGVADWSVTQADTVDALLRYFETDNNGRAVVLVVPDGSDPLFEAVVAGLARLDAREQARIVDVIALGGDLASQPSLDCGVLGSNCVVALPVSARGSFLKHLGAQPSGGIHPLQLVGDADLEAVLDDLRSDWIAYLEANVSKPAEPLGDFETIAIAPIHSADGDRVED